MEKSGEKSMTIQKTSSFQDDNETSRGKLYLVPTPIGNLKDMSPRAIEILNEVDIIAAEDTRNTQKLLNFFEIHTKQTSFHKYNTQQKIPELIELLKSGKQIAQVSDAGTPSISDPGHELVESCIQNQIPVIAIPGPSASITALIASGLAPQPFIFYGFLPRKKTEQVKELEKLNRQEYTQIFYEAPHRLAKTLKAMIEILGEERKVVLCRELTKRYEEYLRGNLADALEWAKNDEVRGEFVIIVEGNHNIQEEQSENAGKSLSEQVNYLIETENLKPNAAIKKVAQNNHLKKQVVYNEFHGLNSEK